MQTPHSTRTYESTSEAPIVPNIADRTQTEETRTGSRFTRPETPPARTDGGRGRTDDRFDLPPTTDYAAGYTRDREEIEPGVADIR